MRTTIVAAVYRIGVKPASKETKELLPGRRFLQVYCATGFSQRMLRLIGVPLSDGQFDALVLVRVQPGRRRAAALDFRLKVNREGMRWCRPSSSSGCGVAAAS